MSLDQDIRFRDRIPNDNFNVEGLFSFITPSRIIVIARDPLITDGQLFYYAINSVTGGFWFKSDLGWIAIYNFNVTPGTGLTDLSNVGTGTGQIYTGVISPAGIANLRTISSTGGTITISQNANTLNLEFNNVAGYITNTANLAGGNGQIANGKTGTIANFRTLTSTGGTVTITNDANTVNIEATSTAGFINNIVNLVAGAGELFSGPIVGSTANFRTLNSPNASILLSATAGTVDLRVNPNLIFKDAASFSCPTVTSQLLSVVGTPIPLPLPFVFNGGLVSRGAWTAGVGIIERTFATNAPAPYLYNVQCSLEFSSPTVSIAYALIRFDLSALTGNITFAGNFTSSATLTLCGSFNGSYVGSVTINTLCTVSDNSPAQFGINATTTNVPSVTIVNRSTQVTIVQI